MVLLAKQKAKVRYGVLVDIGSGSVLVAIIKSNSQLAYPEIIWAKREFVPLRQSDSTHMNAKHIMVSLMNALVSLDSEGKRALELTSQKIHLTDVQVTIAAPWSYTVTKEISYSQNKNFIISRELVGELLRTASTKVAEELSAQEKIQQLGLVIITKTIIGLIANGYDISEARNQSAGTLKVVQTNVVAQDYLVEALDNTLQKVMSRASSRLYSFMLVYYSVIRKIQPDLREYCLVDITYEATELGVVRDGILRHTTHTPFGSFSIAREISNSLGVPLEEAFGYLHMTDLTQILEKYSDDKQADIKKIFSAYEEKLTGLFHETGDLLSLPKKIFIHGDLRNETFFQERVNNAAQKITKSSHAVYLTSTELLKKFYVNNSVESAYNSNHDTALLISAQFFHMPEQHMNFEQR